MIRRGTITRGTKQQNFASTCKGVIEVILTISQLNASFCQAESGGGHLQEVFLRIYLTACVLDLIEVKLMSRFNCGHF